jgi:hypothetical protein
MPMNLRMRDRCWRLDAEQVSGGFLENTSQFLRILNAIRLSNGSIAYKSFMQMMPQLLHQVKRFLLAKGVIGYGEFDELCVKLEKELTNEDFCGLAFVARVWGRCW